MKIKAKMGYVFMGYFCHCAVMGALIHCLPAVLLGLGAMGFAWVYGERHAGQ
jgi:hypothetical protein